MKPCLHSYFVRFNEMDLQEFGVMVGAKDGCRQKITSRSIVIIDGTNYWKYIIQKSEVLNALQLIGKDLGDHVVKYEHVDHQIFTICTQVHLRVQMHEVFNKRQRSEGRGA